jgi:hypothetical protein
LRQIADSSDIPMYDGDWKRVEILYTRNYLSSLENSRYERSTTPRDCDGRRSKAYNTRQVHVIRRGTSSIIIDGPIHVIGREKRILIPSVEEGGMDRDRYGRAI